MPSFNFAPVSKPKGVRTYKKKENVVEGVVWIDNKANYYVLIDNKDKYLISASSYDCRGHKIIYSKHMDKNNRLVLIRHDDYKPNRANNIYAPFGVGCVVNGYIMNNIFYFNKVVSYYNEFKSKGALENYRKNYEYIKALIGHIY